MSRIPLTSSEEQPEPIRQWMADRGNLNVFRLLANAPDVFAGWTRMIDELFASPTFSRRMREVVILRVAHLQGSRYELAQHVAIARTAEVLMVINRYSGLALMLNALDVDLDDSARLPIPPVRS